MSLHRDESAQRGLVLAVALIWLVVATLLLFSSVQNALQEQKAARAFRDRAVAFQAAEMGLVDAEADIAASPSSTLSRSAMFAVGRFDGFPTAEQPLCRHGRANRLQGLCRIAQREELLSLLADEVAGEAVDGSVDAIAVEYGRFTGRILQTGGGMLPARLPRYVIELVRDQEQEQAEAREQVPQQEPATSSTTGAGNNKENNKADRPTAILYRITAIGFGPQPEVQVVLQSFYRKV